jgi:hypothetical protein
VIALEAVNFVASLMCVGDDGSVESILLRHQELEHHDIGEQDVGLRLPDAFTLTWAVNGRLSRWRNY